MIKETTFNLLVDFLEERIRKYNLGSTDDIESYRSILFIIEAYKYKVYNVPIIKILKITTDKRLYEIFELVVSNYEVDLCNLELSGMLHILRRCSFGFVEDFWKRGDISYRLSNGEKKEIIKHVAKNWTIEKSGAFIRLKNFNEDNLISINSLASIKKNTSELKLIICDGSNNFELDNVDVEHLEKQHKKILDIIDGKQINIIDTDKEYV